jgi:hypothetical protein
VLCVASRESLLWRVVQNHNPFQLVKQVSRFQASGPEDPTSGYLFLRRHVFPQHVLRIFPGFFRKCLARAVVRLIFPQRMHGVARRNGLRFGFFGACGNVVYAV